MKIPYIVMKKSAMCQQSRISILSNEMIRRLSNCNWMERDTTEKRKVIEQYVVELKKSGYGRMESKEVILCGMKGWKTKMERRELEGRMYRNGRSTLAGRCKKKLTAKTNWYKKRRVEEDGKDQEDRKKKYQYRKREDDGRKANNNKKEGNS